MLEADIQVVPMVLSHVPAVHAIEEAAFPRPWSLSSFLQEIEQNKAARYLVCLLEGEVVAYGGMWFIIDEAHITNIAVSPKHRRQGFGRRIVEGLLELARENGMHLITLEVRRSNEVAQTLYHQMGFEDVGYRKRYYEDNGEDALIMYRTLGSEDT